MNLLQPFLKKYDAYIISTDCSNQSCVHDDIKTVREEMEGFEFSKSEIHKIMMEINNMKYYSEKWFYNDNGYKIKIRKSKMDKNKLNNLPEFNGW